MSHQIPLVTILGPTAVGKTAFAAHLAISLNGEVISADSRQVFKDMDIGTGKDLLDYHVENHLVASHLIDIAEPGTEYNVYLFQRDFKTVYTSITGRGKTPVLCGGTGMYLESVLLGYSLMAVPTDEDLRKKLDFYSDAELAAQLSSYRQLHNSTDILDRGRLLRAIEIEVFKEKHNDPPFENKFNQTPVLGLRFDRSIIRDRISSRLHQRLNEGMVDEVRGLLNRGISKEQLMFYGLEYKYITLYLSGEFSYNQMVTHLNTAIHQFAKRQMTWFRRMENKGIRIFWLDGANGLRHNLDEALAYISTFK